MTKRHQGASCEALKHMLADTYVLQLKTQNVHWNMQGESFIAIHRLLDEQYSALAEAIDEMAERIRALEEDAPASMTQMLEAARLEESVEPIKDQRQAIALLVADHKTLSGYAAAHIEVLEKQGDYGTVDLLTDRIREHDKFAWLLAAHLSA